MQVCAINGTCQCISRSPLYNSLVAQVQMKSIYQTQFLFLTLPFQDDFTAMREQYMRGGEGFLLVYSITSRRSFNEMRRYRETVNRVRNYERVPIILVGNKSDLASRREVIKLCPPLYRNNVSELIVLHL